MNIINGIKNPKLILQFINEKKMKTIKKENYEIKQYNNYQNYIKHQRGKKPNMNWLLKYDIDYRKELVKRLTSDNIVKKGSSVLCLAARIGTEVKSFIDLNCFAVGIDINLYKNNKYVVYGDFHNLQYSCSSVDIIFSNSLDHSLDIEKLIEQAHRVLKNNGLFILEIINVYNNGGNFGYYEASLWGDVNIVLDKFRKIGFKKIKQYDFNKNWQCVYFEKKEVSK